MNSPQPLSGRDDAETADREERRRFDDLEPGETEFQRGPTPVEDTRREELNHWRRS